MCRNGFRCQLWESREVAAAVRVNEQLDSFVGEVFSSLARKDRRATAGLYVRG
jgi:hypothetical protein